MGHRRMPASLRSWLATFAFLASMTVLFAVIILVRGGHVRELWPKIGILWGSAVLLFGLWWFTLRGPDVSTRTA